MRRGLRNWGSRLGGGNSHERMRKRLALGELKGGLGSPGRPVRTVSRGLDF